MLKKRKTYSRPKRPFDKVRILEENEIKKQYGLKNKREIWKAEAKIKSMREKAKKLISADFGKQEALFNQLGKIGINVSSIGDVLALDKKDYLEQRLQTVLVRKGICSTMKQARQMITHKKIMVDGKVVNVPSYTVPIAKRDKITIKEKKKILKKEEAQEEKVEEIKENGEENA